MRNIIVVDVNTACRCDCYENISDGTNSVIFLFKVNSYINPKVEVIVCKPESEEETYTADLTVDNGMACYTVPPEYYKEHSGAVKVRFIDDEYSGTWFTLSCTSASFGGTDRTLWLFRGSEFEYLLSVRKVAKYSDLEEEIEKDPTLVPSIKLVAGENITITEEFDEATNTTTYTISATGTSGGMAANGGDLFKVAEYQKLTTSSPDLIVPQPTE